MSFKYQFHYHGTIRKIINPLLLQVLVRNQTYKNASSSFTRELQVVSSDKDSSQNTPVNTNDEISTEPFVDFSLVYESTYHDPFYYDDYDVPYSSCDSDVPYSSCDRGPYVLKLPEDDVPYDDVPYDDGCYDDVPCDDIPCDSDVPYDVPYEPYVDFSSEYACYPQIEDSLALNRTTTNPFYSQTKHRTVSESETSVKPLISKKRRVFLEPRVSLADPTKGVRFSFEMPYVDVDETDEESVLNTESSENRNIWRDHIHHCMNGLED
jgi:hypothetical protein